MAKNKITAPVATTAHVDAVAKSASDPAANRVEIVSQAAKLADEASTLEGAAFRLSKFPADVQADAVRSLPRPKALKLGRLIGVEIPEAEKGGRPAASYKPGETAKFAVTMEGAEKNKPAVRFRIDPSQKARHVEIVWTADGFTGRFVD